MKKRLVLTARDVELFRWLWMLRVLTLGQLRRLGYYQPDTGQLSVLDNVRKRLKRLWDAGYFEGTRLLDSKERVYFLAEQALSALRDHYGLEQRRLYQPKLESDLQLLHPLMVSECATRMVEAVRETDFSLVDLEPLQVPFFHARTVGDSSKRRHVDRFIAQEDVPVLGEAPVRIRPDLVFGLAKGGRARLYFVEADRDTEAPPEVLAKQLAYARYWDARDPRQPDQPLWRRYGEMFRDFRVLIVTTSTRRRDNLVAALEGQEGWDLVALTSLEQLKESHPLFDGIWVNQQGSARALARR